MKKIFQISLMAIMALLVAACGKESPFDFGSEGSGSLSVKKMIVKIENEENVVRSAIDVGSFLVDIIDKDGKVVEQYTYVDMPEVITLPAGDYTVKVRSHEVQPVQWDTPYFEGQQNFTIKAREITEVETVVCKLANVRVTIIFDDDLKANMSSDAKVNVVMGEGASVDFLKDETRSAYFQYVEGSSTLVATFTGHVEGGVMENFKAYTDVKPGNHYKITYRYHSGDLPDDQGTVTFNGLTINATVEEVNMTVNVNPEDDILADDSRPNEGDPEPDPGTDPDPTPGVGPSIVAVAPVVLNSPNEVYDTSSGAVLMSSVVLNVHSDTGITEFKVVIDSPVLPEDELVGLNLAKELDLVNPGSLESGISGLGLPVNVGGKKDVEFDISRFIELLGILGPATSNFHITVADASGTTKSTLILVVK